MALFNGDVVDTALAASLLLSLVLRLYYTFRHKGATDMGAGGTVKETLFSKIAVIIGGSLAILSTLGYYGLLEAATEWDPILPRIAPQLPPLAKDLTQFLTVTTIPSPRPLVLRWCGVVLVVLAGVLLVVTHAHLGEAWAPFVSVKPKQKLVQTGPFRYVRHPMYTSVLLFAAGIGAGTASWVLFVCWLAMFLALSLCRIPVEERVLVGAFGVQYTNYSQYTHKVVPCVF